MRYKKLLATLLLTTLAFQVGCSGGSEEDVLENVGTDTIVIGEVGPITGEAAIYGTSTFKGAQLALEEFGTVNGKNVVIKQYDDQANPTESINAYNRLVDKDKVTAILGGVTSGGSSAIALASTENNTPMVTPTSTLDSITGLGTNVFRACFNDSYQGEVMAKYAVEKLGVKTAGVIYNNSSDYSTGLATAFIETFEELGGEIVANEAYSDSDVNFKVQLSKIDSANPDVIFAPDYYEKIALLSKQIRDMGMDGIILGGDGWDGVLELVNDKEILNNTYICNAFSTDDSSDSVQKFITSYETKYNEKPNGFAASGYDGMLVLLNALEKADSEGNLTNEGIIEALKQTDVEGVNGKITLNENRDAIKGAVILSYVDGKEVLVDKISAN